MEIAFLYVAMFCYASSFCLQLISAVFGKDRLTRLSVIAGIAGVLAHTVNLIAWSVKVGHLPVGNTYELNLLGAWITVLLFLILCLVKKPIQSLAIVVMPICFLVMGLGLLTGRPIEPLSPAYASFWLVIHVLFAFLAFGSFVVAFAASCRMLLKRRGKEEPGGAWSAEKLDGFAFRMVLFGLVNHAIMLASGAVWADRLWGKFWSWDPIETWSLIVFLAYGAFLHLAGIKGWRGKKAAWVNVVAFGLLLFSFWGIQYIAPSFHLFENIGELLGRE